MEEEEYYFNTTWTVDGEDVINQEIATTKTDIQMEIKEAKHHPVKNDHRSHITSWFQKNKHANDCYGNEINQNRQKRYMEADEKVEALKSKYSRIRKGSSYTAMQNAEKEKLAAAKTISTVNTPSRNVDKISLQAYGFGQQQVHQTPSIRSSSSSQSSDLTSSSSGGYRPSEIILDSQKNLDNLANFGEESVRTSNNANTIVSKTKTYIPSIATQVAKIEQVRLFDLKYGTCHAEVLKATKFGVQCEVCDVTLTDLSCILRMDDNILRTHCHLGSKAHNSNLDHRKASKMRQPSLITLLSEITPNVDRKVKLFRFDLTKLLLSLRVSLNSVNKVGVLSEKIIHKLLLVISNSFLVY